MKSYRTNQRDNNHEEIADIFRGKGYSWTDTWRFGGGFPDGIISTPTFMALVEIKNGKVPLTEAEERFHKQWRGPAILIIRSSADALSYTHET